MDVHSSTLSWTFQSSVLFSHCSPILLCITYSLGLEWYCQCCRYPIPRYSRPAIPIFDTDANTVSDLILATVNSL